MRTLLVFGLGGLGLVVASACSSFEDAPAGAVAADAGTTDSATDGAPDERDAADAADAAVLPFDDALLARWKFDEKDGTKAADSVKGNDATLTAPAGWAEGKIGGALDTAGLGSATVPMHPSLGLGAEVTVAMWVNCQESATDSFLFTYGANFNIKLNARAPQIALEGGADGGSGGAARAGYNLPPGEWHHLAFTVKDGAAAIYVDGFPVQLDTQLLPGALLEPTALPIVIGTDNGSGNNHTNGRIDDLRLYERALVKDEVEKLAAFR